MRLFGGLITSINLFVGAGTEAVLTVPAGHWYTILSFQLNLLAFPVAANRAVRMAVVDGSGNVLGIWGGNKIQGTGASFTYTGPARAMGESDAVVGGNVLIPMPSFLTLAPGMSLQTATRNLQAGDQYVSANYYLEDHGS